ncbi:hypothetical protein ACOMHN_029961 [Nucella lapillus]
MQRSRVSHHPCHRLSVPSAKRFWCRHCMMVFEDAITRWRHSRSCRSAGFDNLVRRREIETQSLQKMAETLDPEMVTQISVPREDGSSNDLCCFICRQRFESLDEMREHVKYPCNKPSSVQRAPIPLIFQEPTFGTGIQQHYTDGPALGHHSQQGPSSASTSNSQAVTVYMNEGEQAEATDGEAKPTNIYVNENGETVIEVENLDLNTKSGELSLAHLLTQLSQQGIVFDQQQTHGETEVMTTTTTSPPQEHHHVVQESVSEVDYGQPTAVDAANTLTQLAGSAFRAVNSAPETYVPPAKRIKTEQLDMQYKLEQPDHAPVQTYLQKEEPYVETVSEKYIICTDESDVLRVMQANSVAPEVVEMPPDIVESRIHFQNGESGATVLHNALAEGEVEETATIHFQGQPRTHSQVGGFAEVEGGTAESSLTGSEMIVVQHNEHNQMAITDPAAAQHLVKSEDPSTQVVLAEHSPPPSSNQVVIEQDPSSSQVVVAEQNLTANQVMIPEQNPPTTSVVVTEQNPPIVVMAEHNPPTTSVVTEQNPPTVVMAEQNSPSVVIAEQNQVVITEQNTPTTSVVLTDQNNPHTTQVILAEDENPSTEEHLVVEAVETVTTYATGQENTVTVTEQVDSGQEGAGEDGGRQCVVVTASSQEVSSTLVVSSQSDSAVTGLLEMSGGGMVTASVPPDHSHSQQTLVTEPSPEAAMLLPQIISVTTSAEPDGTTLVVQQDSVAE